jgi:hypothetical protein
MMTRGGQRYIFLRNTVQALVENNNENYNHHPIGSGGFLV